MLRGKEDKLKPAFPNSFRCSINIIAGIFQRIIRSLLIDKWGKKVPNHIDVDRYWVHSPQLAAQESPRLES
jgi:hypothetical protein